MKLRIIVLLALIFCRSAFSQTYSVSSDGKDFFVGYMYPSYNKVAKVAGFYGAYVLISSFDNNQVTISYFNGPSNSEEIAQIYSIGARNAIQVQMQTGTVRMSDTLGDVPEYTAMHITAKKAVHVEFYSTGACAGGSFLTLPTPLLGRKYVVASYNDNPGDGGYIGTSLPPSYIETSHGFFQIICPFDSTRVTITPTVKTMGGHAGITYANSGIGTPHPYTVLLQRGQCYLVKSAGGTTDYDLSGSTVESDKPVAVIAGHENAYLGSTNGVNLDGRNFLIQQMLPVSLWDSTGYVTIPLKDAQPLDPTLEGFGENFRTYSDDANGVSVIGNKNSGSISLPAFLYTHSEGHNIGDPIEFHSPDNKKFSVMMYDLRNMGRSEPYTSPTMMTVIPISRWKSSYVWYVPAATFEMYQEYYANIIGSDSDINFGGMTASFNNGTVKGVKLALKVDEQFNSIPKHPELSGIRCRLSPGSYYVTAPHPFIVYNYGFRGIDPDRDIGDYDGDDFYYSYGSPVGMKLPGTPHMRVAVDTLCTSWHVCVTDSTLGLTNQGIESIDLMNDPTGDQFDIHPGKQYFNTYFNPSIDPNDKKEINLSGNDTSYCFDVLIQNPFDSAYAPLFIVDAQGGAVLVELHYYPHLLRPTIDTGKFLALQLNKDLCMNIVIKNTAKFNPGNPNQNSVKINSAFLKHKTSGFAISNTIPTLPTSIRAGDSLVISTCYIAKDTNLRIDTLMIVTDCFSAPIVLIGTAITPLIYATDVNFGNVLVGTTSCRPVTVANKGTAPFTLTQQWLTKNFGSDFSFQNATLLPLTIPPGGRANFTFCFTPHDEKQDTAMLFWATTIEEPYKHSIKDSTILYGRGVNVHLEWDRALQSFELDTNGVDSLRARVRLVNKGVIVAHINSVFITGTDSSEFSIVGDSVGFLPLVNYDLAPAVSMFVDIAFKPDETKPYPARFAARHAKLVATGESEADQIIDLTGRFNGIPDAVSSSSPQTFFTIHPNPVSGNSIIVSFSDSRDAHIRVSTVEIFDMLGREVYRQIFQNSGQFEIPIGGLPNGIYTARIHSGNYQGEKKFEILR